MTLFLRHFSNISKSYYQLRHIRPAVRVEQLGASTGSIFMKSDVWVFFENMSKKFCENRTRIKGTLHENQYTILIISCPFLLGMGNIWDKCCRENQNTHFVFNNFFLENRAAFEIMWKNVVETNRPQMTIWRMRIAWWITKTTDTHSEYVISITFPLQKW